MPTFAKTFSPMGNEAILEYAKRIQALSQIGLTYSPNPYDLERYTELKEIGLKLMELTTQLSIEQLQVHFSDKKEYITPKVDVRAVVFNEAGDILLVKESADGRWSLPGGWADIGYSPREVAVKEVREETGLEVRSTRLLAVLDKSKHPHPPALEYAYKIFVECLPLSGHLGGSFDILDCGWFAQDNIPPLSLERITHEQIDLMFDYRKDPELPVSLD
jgi:ADP-ribose pyrophosphatase YjhB (NUDIX family)